MRNREGLLVVGYLEWLQSRLSLSFRSGLVLSFLLLLLFANHCGAAEVFLDQRDVTAYRSVRASGSNVIFETSFSSCTLPICPIDRSVWQAVDQGIIGAPSYWIETDVDANGMRYQSGAVLEQTKNIFTPSGAGGDPYAGTFLEYIGPGSSSLADYHLYVGMNAAVNGMVGVMFRIQDSKNYYRFVWSNGNDPSGSSASASQQLQVVADGNWKTIATAAHAQPFPLGDFVALHVRCDGARIRIWINGASAIDIEDHTFTSGTWALYNARCPGVRYANILVTSVSNSGPGPTPPPFPVAGGVQSARASTAPLPAFQGADSRRVIFPLNFTALMLSKFTEGVGSNVTQALLTDSGVRGALVSNPPLVMVDLRQGSVIATYAGIINASATSSFIRALNGFVCSGRLSNLTELGPISCGSSNALAIQVQLPTTSPVNAPPGGVSAGTVVAIVVILVVLAVLGTALLCWCLLRKRRNARGDHRTGHLETFSAADVAEKGTRSPASTESDGFDHAPLDAFGSAPVWNWETNPPYMFSMTARLEEGLQPFCMVQRVQRLLLALIGEQRQHFGTASWLLVLDARTHKLITSSVGNILSRSFTSINICLVEQLSRRGGDELQRPTIYLLAPAGDWMTNVARIEAKRNAPVPVLFFATRYPNAPLPPRRSMPWFDTTGRSMVLPIHLDFIPLEQRLVTLDTDGDVFGLLYGDDAPETCAVRFQLMEELGHQIGTLLYGMGAGSFTNEPPWIQIHTSPAASEQATSIARAAQTYVSAHLLPLFSQSASSRRGALHLLLMDRAVDPLMPLLHVDTYRGMLLESEFVAWPSEQDPIWQHLRGCPVAEAVALLWNLARPYLPLRDHPQNNASSAPGDEETDMAKLVQQLEAVNTDDSSQREELDRLRWHALHLQRCLTQQETRNLAYLWTLERKMLTGVECDGKTRTSTAVVRRALEEILQSDAYEFHDKVRLLLLFIGCRDPHALPELIQKIPHLSTAEHETLAALIEVFQRRLRAAKWASRAARVRRRRRARALARESLATLLLPETMLSQILLQYIGAFDTHQRDEMSVPGDDRGNASDQGGNWLALSSSAITDTTPTPCSKTRAEMMKDPTTWSSTRDGVSTPVLGAAHRLAGVLQSPASNRTTLTAMLTTTTAKRICSESRLPVLRDMDADKEHNASLPMESARRNIVASGDATSTRNPEPCEASTSLDGNPEESFTEPTASTAGCIEQRTPLSRDHAREASTPHAMIFELMTPTEDMSSLPNRLHQAAQRYQNDRFLFVIIGGVSAFEIEQIYALAAYLDLEIVLGGTSLLSPNRYLASMAKL